MKKSLIKKYAKLAVRVGADVQKGQPVIVYASVDQYEFVTMVVDECYKAGAKNVDIEWHYQPITKLNYRHKTLKNLSQVPHWKEEKLKLMAEEYPCRIHILSDDPDGLKGINQEKLQKANIAVSKVTKPYRDAIENKHQWTIIGVPSVKWAKKVFPGERASVAVEKLWKQILATVRITEDNDPVEEWEKHNKNLAERCAFLNSHKFDTLEYSSSNGTSFRVGLIDGGLWHGGSSDTLQGVRYNPNMPTEEVYTSPMRGKAEGRVVSTKPLSYQGQLIDKFYIDFKDGKAVNWGAEKGEELLTKMITMDEGASHLGEVALIPNDSPINNSGVLFYETLFDENASCHVALGMGFAECLEGFENMTLDECHEKGINDSIIHVDFMIGADDMKITGYKDGKATPIFVNGNWA